MSLLESGRILVTGGAGFIGSALVWALNERGIDHILITDFLGNGDKYRNLVPLRFDDYMEADTFFTRLGDSPEVFNDIKTVFHLGACSSTTETNCRYLIENNYAYTCRLADWATQRELRFIYASSAATYGDGGRGMSDEVDLISGLRPLNMYGYSKHLFDLYAMRRGYLGGMVGLKYFNIFGPNEDHKADMRSVANKAFHEISRTGRVSLFKSYRAEYADGEQRRDFLYVKDAVAMTLFLAEEKTASGLFNIGGGTAHTFKSLVKPVFKAMGLPVKVEFVEMPDALRPTYQYHTCADISRLRKSGYTDPVTDLNEAVGEYCRQYLMPNLRLGEAD